MIEVEIEVEEIGRALDLAYERWSLSTRDGKRDQYNWTDGLINHYWGCIGEIACAKALDRYWWGHVNEYKGGKADIGVDIEVRHRVDLERDLIIEKKDPSNRIYVLTRGQPPVIQVVGWISKEDCLQSDMIKMKGRDVYCIKESRLKDMMEIK